MEFTGDVVTEITVPNNVQFAPGINVVGIGQTLPPELVAAGYVNAIVWYSTDWDPTSTAPKAKFKFMATLGGSLVIGMGYSNNPSVNQTATITRLASFGMIVGGGVALTDVEFYHPNDTSDFQISQLVTPAGVPYTQEFDSAGNEMWDDNWQAVTLLNGWAAFGTPGDWYQGLRIRKLPFGGVILNGTLESPATVQNTIANVGAFYRPGERATNVCNSGTAITAIHAHPNGDITIDGPQTGTFANINVFWVTL